MLFAALTLGAAVVPIVWLARARFAGSRSWLAGSVAAATISGSALLVGPWALLSVHLRPVAALALFVALAISRVRAGRLLTGPADPAAPRRRALWNAGVGCLFAPIFVNAFAGRFPPRGVTELRFPLEGGRYAVIQGGGSVTLNPFHRWFPPDAYALDLVKLNATGNRARGIAPRDLHAYASFNTPVHSPCAGSVEDARDEVPDNEPGRTDPAHLPGNHVFLRCGALRVLLAHLAPGSVAVSAGDAVQSGQLIGRIGNSGNTMEPHLHIGAMLAQSGTWPHGTPAAVTFGGRFLAMNDVVKR
jgi:murein DD-endopeptidase MepM/ murein hydrolase activator NlpD